MFKNGGCVYGNRECLILEWCVFVALGSATFMEQGRDWCEKVKKVDLTFLIGVHADRDVASWIDGHAPVSAIADEKSKMSSISGELPRSPLENVLNFLPHGHEKALKHAFYNAAALVCVLFAAAATAAVYFVLQPFLRPLLWAVLFGSVLHPFKQQLTAIGRHWLEGLICTGTPLVVGVVALPFSFIDVSSQAVGAVVQKHFRSMGAVTVALGATYIVGHFTPASLLKIANTVKNFVSYYTHDIFSYFSSIWVWSLVIGFVLLVLFHWTPASSRFLRIFSMPVWIVMLLHLATVLGNYRVPVFLAVITLMIVGFVMEVNDVRLRYIQSQGNGDEDVHAPTAIQTAWAVITGKGLPSPDAPTACGVRVAVQEADKSEDVHAPSDDVPKPSPSFASRRKSTPFTRQQSSFLNYPRGTESTSSNSTYIYTLLWACTLVQLWRHVWLWPLLAFPAGYLIIRRVGSQCGLWQFIWERIKDLASSANTILEERMDAIFPAPVRGFGKLTLRGDKKVISFLEQSIDTFTSIAAILSVIIFVTMATIFISVQIHAESMHLVRVTSNLVNTTVLHNSDLQKLLPEGVANMLDDMFQNAYVYGREWTVKMVKSWVDEKDEEKAAAVETQMLELWDKVYQAWTDSSNHHASDTDTQGGGLMGKIVEELKAPGFFNLSALTDFVKENIGTFMAVIDASWTVLKGNISLAISALTATVSLLFGGGTALLNFLISFFVFMTALFYLLSASCEQYKPVVLFNKLTPAGSGSRFGQAVEEAINGVFAASFKMSFFYGLWTWLIHTLFNVKMVYIPTALATIFGAIPFLGTYWAAVPAVLELWMVQGRGLIAAFLFVCQLLPMSCVDTAIYSDIRGGGHPYLTGLAVAGGIFCLGAEGAIIGPLLLCCLFVAVNMYGNMIHESPVNDPTRRLNAKSFLMKRYYSSYGY